MRLDMICDRYGSAIWLPRRLKPGDTRRTKLHYHGDVFDLLQLDPVICDEHVKALANFERAEGIQLPEAFKEFLSLDNAAFLFAGELDGHAYFVSPVDQQHVRATAREMVSDFSHGGVYLEVGGYHDSDVRFFCRLAAAFVTAHDNALR